VLDVLNVARLDRQREALVALERVARHGVRGHQRVAAGFEPRVHDLALPSGGHLALHRAGGVGHAENGLAIEALAIEIQRGGAVAVEAQIGLHRGLLEGVGDWEVMARRRHEGPSRLPTKPPPPPRSIVERTGFRSTDPAKGGWWARN